PLWRVTEAEDPAQPGVVVGEEDRAGARLVQIGDVDKSAAQSRAEVGRNHRREDLEEEPGAVRLDAEALPQGAARAVGGDEVVGVDDRFGAGAAVAQARGHAILVNRTVDELSREAEVRTQGERPIADDRLELILVDRGE